jgi:hypothetical protein
MIGHFIHHLAIGIFKVVIILEKITVGIDMANDQFLGYPAIAMEEIGIAGIVIDDHFIDLGEAIGIGFREMLEFHAKAPVGIANRKAPLTGDHVDFIPLQDFKENFKEIKAKRRGVFLDFLLEL